MNSVYRTALSILTTATAFALPLNGSFAADPYPSKPIEIFVHSGPGSGVDVFARTAAALLNKDKLIDRPITVLNKSGGGGANAVFYARRQAGNPYSVWFITNNYATTQERGLPSVKFIPVAMMEAEYSVLAVRADSPYKSAKDLVEAARKQPGKLALGVGQYANPDHQATYQLAKAGGVDFNYVLLQSGSQAVTALLAGDINFTFGDYVEVEGLLRAGTLRLLGVAAPQRLSFLQDLPTLKEQGYNVLQVTYRGVVLPDGVPHEAVAYWEDRLEKLRKSPGWQDYLSKGRKTDVFATGNQFTKIWQEIAEREGPAIAALRNAK